MSSKSSLLAVAVLLVFPAAAFGEDAPRKWEAWIDGGAFYSNKDESRGETTLWAPLLQSPTAVFFFEGQGKLFEESQREGNFALAYRQMFASGWNLGAWGGYDIRSTSLGSRFSQVAGGLEALSTDWDFRLNGYLPLNDSEIVSESIQQSGGAATILLNGSSILMQTGIISSTSRVSELAFGGFDAELGLRLPVESLSIDPRVIDLRIYGGGFYFDNSDADQSIAGPKARAELRINDVVGSGSRLTLEAAFSSDDIRGELYEAGARLRIPLGEQRALASMSIQDQRMSEQLRRDTDIVASTKKTSTSVNTLMAEAVQDAATNVDLDKVAYVDPTTSGGITGVATAAGANTLIIANGAFNANTVLQSAQTLLGGGGSIMLRGKTTGTQMQFTAQGAAATITGQAAGHVITTRNDAHIVGITIDATSATGGIIVGPGTVNALTQNVVIDHNVIDAGTHDAIVTSAGVAGATSSHVVIADNTITSAGNGVNVFQTSDVVVRGNDISGTTNAAVIAQNGTANLAILDNALTTTGGLAISLGSSGLTGIDIEGNTIVSHGGIVIFGSGGDGTIANNTFDMDGWNAISALGSNNTYQGTGNVLVGSGFACSSVGSNPGMSVSFTNGATCP